MFSFSWTGFPGGLREPGNLTVAEATELTQRLRQLDDATPKQVASHDLLRLIGGHPRVRAADLARLSGMQKDWLKIRIRKLNNLGLTEVSRWATSYRHEGGRC